MSVTSIPQPLNGPTLHEVPSINSLEASVSMDELWDKTFTETDKYLKNWSTGKQYLLYLPNQKGYACRQSLDKQGNPESTEIYVEVGNFSWFGSDVDFQTSRAVESAISKCRKVSRRERF